MNTLPENLASDPYLSGYRLSPEDQRTALAMFVHRFTRDHKPAWASKPRPDGSAYPVQFDSDKEWLASTVFRVTKAGRLDMRANDCQSFPTWPDNPELRRPR